MGFISKRAPDFATSGKSHNIFTLSLHIYPRIISTSLTLPSHMCSKATPGIRTPDFRFCLTGKKRLVEIRTDGPVSKNTDVHFPVNSNVG